MRVRFFDGPFEGIGFDCPLAVDKVVIQSGDTGRTYRYECDAECEQSGERYARLVLTYDVEEFDAELKADEKGTDHA